MSEIFKVIIEFASSKSPGLFFGVATICIAVLGYPATWFGAADLEKLVSSYRGYLMVGTLAGYTLAFTTSGWLKNIFSSAAKYLWRPIQIRHIRTLVQNSLGAIPPQEWLYLAYCVSRSQDTIYAKLGDPVAQSLTHKGFFSLAAGAGQRNHWPHTLDPVLLKVLQEHPRFNRRALDQHQDILNQMDYEFSGRNGYF